MVILFGCADGPFDPSIVNPSIQGITATDETGAIVGPRDRFDWQVADGPTSLPVDRSDPIGWQPASGAIGPAGKVIPSHITVRPGFPNPTEGQFAIVHEVPAPCLIYTWVLDSRMNTVWRERLTAADGGNWAVFLDFADGRQTFRKGIYRVVYEYDFGKDRLHGYGDVLYTDLNEQRSDTRQN